MLTPRTRRCGAERCTKVGCVHIWAFLNLALEQQGTWGQEAMCDCTLDLRGWKYGYARYWKELYHVRELLYEQYVKRSCVIVPDVIIYRWSDFLDYAQFLLSPIDISTSYLWIDISNVTILQRLVLVDAVPAFSRDLPLTELWTL